jgi:hypothetical protein
MASKELLKSLDFRRFNLRLEGISKIVVRYGASKEKGHVAARKFFKNYLPVLLYHNPSIVASVKKYGSNSGGNEGTKEKNRDSESIKATTIPPISTSKQTSDTTLSPLNIAALCELSEEPHVAFFGEDGKGRVFKTREIAEEFKKQEGSGNESSTIQGNTTTTTSSGSVGSGGGIKGLALHVDRFIFKEVTGGNDFVAEEKPRKPQGKKGGRRKSKVTSSTATITEGEGIGNEAREKEKLA